MLVTLFMLLIAGALILAGCQATRAGYESAPYKVVRSDGKFQVRDYPALTVVETPMARQPERGRRQFHAVVPVHHRARTRRSRRSP